MGTTTLTDTTTLTGRRAWLGLAVLALPTLLVAIDVFVMLLALPRLSEDLGAGGTQQLWVMDSYGFLLSGFMITMGTLGDRIGRRRLLLIGAAGFGVASVLSAYAPSPLLLIVARGLLGIAGATLAPSTLALISTMFPDPRKRGMAIGVWMVCFMGGAALGPVVGGLLLEHFWWGSVFLLGVPAMILLLIFGPVLLPEARNAGAGRLDLPSVALSLAAILPLVYGLKELARHGWQPVPVAALVVGLAVGVVFVRRQRGLADPLLDVRLLGNRAFSAALGGMLFGTMLMGAIMLFLTQYLQLVAGLSPLRAGLWMLPSAAVSAVSVVSAPLAARRYPKAQLIGGGLVLAAFGLLVMAQAGSVAVLILGWMVVNVGAAPLITLATDLVVGSVPVERAGSAAAMNQVSGEFGFALGIAALGSLGTLVYRARLGGTIPAARDSLAGATAVAGNLHGQAGAALLAAARQAYTSGLHTVAMVSAVLLLGVAFAIVKLLRHA